MDILAALANFRNYWFRDSMVYSVQVFDDVEQRLGQELPAEYAGFLMESNGGHTLEPLPPFQLYPLEELLERQTAGQPPDVLEIGTDGKDAYAFDLNSDREGTCFRIVKYPCGETNRAKAVLVASQFRDLIATIGGGRIPDRVLPEEPRSIREVFEELRVHWMPEPPLAGAGAFVDAERVLGQALPADYKWLLSESNGGFLSEPLEYLRLYSLEEALDRRGDGQPADVLEIATNDCEGYAFDLADNRDTAIYRIVRYDMGETQRENMDTAATNLAEFFAIICLGWRP